MPRIRSIKPDFFKSEDVAALPLRARLLWIGLWTQCDDHGRYKDSVRIIKGDVWSLDDVSLRDIEEDLSTLEQQRRLVRYEVDGKKYLAVVNWHAHQAINRPSRPKHPAPPMPMASADPSDPNHCDVCAKPGHGTLSPTSVDPHGSLTEPSRQEGKGREGKGREARGKLTEVSPGPGNPAFLPPQDPANVHNTGHQVLQEGPAGYAKTGHLDPDKPYAASTGQLAPDEPHRATPPPDRCPKHVDAAKPPSCGPCADARKARDRWDAAAAARERAQPRCRRHRGQPAHNCALCRSEALADQEAP